MIRDQDARVPRRQLAEAILELVDGNEMRARDVAVRPLGLGPHVEDEEVRRLLPQDERRRRLDVAPRLATDDGAALGRLARRDVGQVDPRHAQTRVRFFEPPLELALPEPQLAHARFELTQAAANPPEHRDEAGDEDEPDPGGHARDDTKAGRMLP